MEKPGKYMRIIRAIAIDDTHPDLDTLSILLAAHCADAVHLMGTFHSVKEGVQAIKNLCPELVFLDVQLQNQTAFDLLRQLDTINFDIIFTTAHSEYAVQAIKLSAMDYLVKPIDSEDLKAAIEKVTNKRSVEERNRQLEIIFDKLKYPKGVSRTITVPTPNGLTILASSDIIRCEGHQSYTMVYTHNGSEKQKEGKYLVAKTLGDYEQLLTGYNFFRVHNSHLINLAFVTTYNNGEGGYVTMINGKDIPVSTRRKNAFLKRLSSE